MVQKHHNKPDPEPSAQKSGSDASLLLFDRVADALESMDQKLALMAKSLDEISETLKKNGEPSPQP